MIRDFTEHFANYNNSKEVKTSRFTFTLLTRITVNILLFSVVLISFKQLFGEPIDCAISDERKELKRTIETKCWMEGVFLDRTLFFGVEGKGIAGPGVGPVSGKYDESNFINQNYYQWVIPMILLQALLLYIARGLWHFFENGLMSKLIEKADYPILTKDWTKKKIHIERYMREVSKKQHRQYAFKYFLCELTAVGFLVINMLIMDWVLGNFWVDFEPAIESLVSQNFTGFSQHSAKFFPKKAKCFYHDFGASGSAQLRDALCFLPQNTVNEKVFVFFYFWYFLLLIVSLVNVAWIVLMVAFKCMRTYDVRRMSDRPNSRRSDHLFYHYSDFGYWFSLRMLHKNISPVLFRDLLLTLKAQDAKLIEELGEDIEADLGEEDVKRTSLKNKIYAYSHA